MRVVRRDGFSVVNCVRRAQGRPAQAGPDVELMLDAHGSLEVVTAVKLAMNTKLSPPVIEIDTADALRPAAPERHPVLERRARNGGRNGGDTG